MLKAATVPIATADRVILDAGPRWYNLAREVVDATGHRDRVIDLAAD